MLVCYVEKDDETDSAVVFMNETTTAPSCVSGMQMTGSMQESDDLNEATIPLPIATNVLPEASTQTISTTVGKMECIYEKNSFQRVCVYANHDAYRQTSEQSVRAFMEVCDIPVHGYKHL